MKEEDKSLVHEELESIVGSENVTDNEIILATYSMGQVGYRSGELFRKRVLPDFIVRAGSVEEIQQILRLANKYKVPVIPVGSQTSMYVEAVPLEGGIMLDMSRMNYIELDEDNMTITFGPGVTQAQLWRELTPKGYKVVYQKLPAATVYMGITTQRGFGPVWQGQTIEDCLEIEVVLPTGEIAKFGTQQYRYEWGPDLMGIFLGAKGMYGIITHQTLRLYPIPPDWVEWEKVDSLFEIPGNTSYENSKAVVRALQRISHDWVNVNFHKNEYVPGREGVRCAVAISGPRERVEFDRKRVEKILKEEGARLLKPREWISIFGYTEQDFWKTEEDYKVNWDWALDPETEDWKGVEYYGRKGTWGDCFGHYDRPHWGILAAHAIVPHGGRGGGGTGDLKLSLVPDWFKRSGEIMAKYGFTPHYRSFHTRDRFMKCVMCNQQYTFNTLDVEETKRASACKDELQHVFFDEFGGANYRLDPSTAEFVIPRLGLYYELMKKIKKMLDPNRIMNPGQMGF